ncbi:MAG: carbon-nitrogen hydrolase family protein [Planctomycetota bacterium]
MQPSNESSDRPAPRPPLKIAAAQIEGLPGQLDKSVAIHAKIVREASQKGVRLVVFPELSLPSYCSTELQESPEDGCVIDLEDPRLGPIREACQETKTVAILGAAVRHRGARGLAAPICSRDGNWAPTYVKQYLADEENDFFTPGDQGLL